MPCKENSHNINAIEFSCKLCKACFLEGMIYVKIAMDL